MNTTEVLSYVSLLEDNLDELEETLHDLLPTDSLADSSRKLPLLERAKLHVTLVYAIESLIFCTSPAIDHGLDALTMVRSISSHPQYLSPQPPGLQRTCTRQVLLRQGQRNRVGANPRIEARSGP
jgi:hypothetical protein